MEATLVKSPPRRLMEGFKAFKKATLVELIENQLIMTPEPLHNHQTVSMDILIQVSNFIRKLNLGELLVAPLDNYLDQKNAYQPDIFFISHDNEEIIHSNGLHGAPDLVIEL